MRLFGNKSDHKYGGRVIYSTEDEESTIEIVDKKAIRSLHFGTSCRQSAINLQEPYKPVLGYSNYMLLGLVLANNPSNILLLGMGGGILARMIMDTGYKGRLVAVEKRPLVIEVAYDYFGLSRQNKFEVRAAEAKSFINKTNIQEYDLILMDIFGPHEIASPVLDFTFLRQCRNFLKPEGFMLVNIWDNPKRVFDTIYYYLGRCFGHEPVCVPVPERSNRILCCSRNQLQTIDKVPSKQALKHFSVNAYHGLQKPIEDFFFQLKKIKTHYKLFETILNKG